MNIKHIVSYYQALDTYLENQKDHIHINTVRFHRLFHLFHISIFSYLITYIIYINPRKSITKVSPLIFFVLKIHQFVPMKNKSKAAFIYSLF